MGLDLECFMVQKRKARILWQFSIWVNQNTLSFGYLSNWISNRFEVHKDVIFFHSAVFFCIWSVLFSVRVFMSQSVSQASGKAFTDPAGSLVNTTGREAVKQRWNDRCPKSLAGPFQLSLSLVPATHTHTRMHAPPHTHNIHTRTHTRKMRENSFSVTWVSASSLCVNISTVRKHDPVNLYLLLANCFMLERLILSCYCWNRPANLPSPNAGLHRKQ